MPPRKKDNTASSGNDAHSKLQARLSGLSIGNVLKLVDDYSDMDVTFIPSGFPSLDLAINKENGGIPRGRHIEVFAKKESSGKTSFTLAIAKTFQDMGLSVGLVDIEKTITGKYLTVHGILTKPDPNRPNIYPIRVMRSEIEPDSEEKLDLYLENVLDTVQKASAVFDLLIVDSVDALVAEQEAQKSAEDNAKVGGISMKLSAFFRKNTNTYATVLWINQTRQSPGTYSPAGVAYVTSGGRALPFYASLRLELSVIEKLKEGENDPYGFVTRIQIVKNKVGAPWRVVDLYYINGEGFSKDYDYFRLGIKLNIIVKKGGWFSMGELFKGQGEFKSYQTIKNDPKLMSYLKKSIDGEDVEVEETPEDLRDEASAGNLMDQFVEMEDDLEEDKQ